MNTIEAWAVVVRTLSLGDEGIRTELLLFSREDDANEEYNRFEEETNGGLDDSVVWWSVDKPIRLIPEIEP